MPRKKDKNFNYFYFKEALEPFTDFDNAYTYCVTDENLSFLPNERTRATSMTYSIKPFAVSVRSEKINFDVEYDKYGIIKKSGSWYSYNDEKIAQGRDAAKEFLKANPDLMEEIDAAVRAAIKEKENE